MQTSFKKERHQLEDAASKLLALALQSGAEAAEVCATFGQKTKITLEKQDYHMASSDDGYQLGLRVLTGEKQGFASCNSTDAKELKEIASRAVEIARFSPQNPYNTILASPNIPKEAPSELWDEPLHQLSLQTQKEWTKAMVDEATRDPRFRLNDGTLSVSSGLYLILNSHGTHKLERETVASWSIMGMGVDGSLITSFDYFSEISRTAAAIPERIIGTTKRFRDRVLGNLKQGPAQSYKGLVVFSPRAVVDVLLSALSYHLNGRSVVEKTGRWQLSDLGKPVLSPLLTLRDLPWLKDRAGCAVFDREGTPTASRTLIEKGVLSDFLLDNYAAKALGLKSSGHAVGGPSAPPTVSAHCLCLDPGVPTHAEFLRQLHSKQKEFLLVNRYSGQVDPVTGDFSGVAKSADWWHAGERLYTAKETLVSGNVFDAFGPALVALTNDREIVEASEECPMALVDNVSVTVGK